MDDQAKKDIAEIKIDIAEIKVDLKHHVKRTDDLQALVEPVVELRSEIIGAVNFIKLIGVLAAIAESIHLFWDKIGK